ncbi:hypothetical protein GUJ93_ZPchr0007g6404 [Zizania palustris]|uniref:Uncharacterized protein n=1 Tax=Zizania palustris TaxID=103762 RepID=A0A8J5VXY2_ZIZPA|nr:hypothetical protein GUJ93_ZPchr0007g6404 [Zizania palustris]
MPADLGPDRALRQGQRWRDPVVGRIERPRGNAGSEPTLAPGLLVWVFLLVHSPLLPRAARYTAAFAQLPTTGTQGNSCKKATTASGLLATGAGWRPLVLSRDAAPCRTTDREKHQYAVRMYIPGSHLHRGPRKSRTPEARRADALP